MRNTISGWVGFLALHLLAFGLHAPASADDQQTYRECSQLVKTDPQAALEMADGWIQSDNHPTAYHCRALALYALSRYNEAARALETLSFIIGDSNPVLWGNVMRQAARAWQRDDDKAKAIVVLTKGISHYMDRAFDDEVIARMVSGLLQERSDLYHKAGRELMALQDLDQAISLTPDDDKLLIKRAELFIEQGEAALAKRDLAKVLIASPTNARAHKLLDGLE